MKKDNSVKSGFSVIIRLLKDAKNIRFWLLLSLIISIIGVLAKVASPYILGDLTDMLYDIWKDGTGFDTNKVLSMCLLLGGIYLVSAFCSWLTMFIMNNVVSRFYTCRMRIRISEKLKRLPISYIDKTPNGEIISRMMHDVSNLGNTLHTIFDMVVNGVVKFVLVTVVLFAINPVMAVIVVALVPISLILSAVIASKSEAKYTEASKLNGKLYSVTEENFSGFDTVKAYGLEEVQADRYAKISEDRRDVEAKAMFLSDIVNPIIVLINNLVYVVLCIVGGYLAAEEVIEISVLVSFVFYAKMFAGPLESIANGLSIMQNTIAAGKRVYELLDEKEMDDSFEGDVFPNLENGEVTFENVYFSYDPEKPLIKDLSFTAKKGQKIAIVGPTGGGKTTIVNLLMRFYDPDKGRILVDGKDISKYSRASVRNLYGMVLQDTWLFSGTVAENIAYGRSDATIEEIKEAAKNAHIDRFIESLPKGYDTLLNEDTANVSGGQKQLITIARVYLANKDMLILDEASSNVDTRTELLIQKTMDELMSDRTSFVIAHRLSTIVNSDLILVVNNGEIVEKGTHNELLKANGLYTEIYNSQYKQIA